MSKKKKVLKIPLPKVLKRPLPKVPKSSGQGGPTKGNRS
jgi:hypothetical protein